MDKTASMQGDGFLAIWSDVDAAQETDYLHWLSREHTAERLGVEGFIAVRVFKALIDGINRFLIIYELESAAALAGQPYLDRLNAPTPWSQRIMPILKNFARGGGRRVASMGTGRGGILAAIPLDGDRKLETPALAGLAAADRIASVHLLETDLARTTIRTNEKSLREKDETFAGLLLVEGIDQMAVRQAVAQSPAIQASDPTLYAMVFALQGRRWP